MSIFYPMFGLIMIVYLISLMVVVGVEEWFIVWVGLEINMMSFLFMVYAKSVKVSEAIGKYYFIQSLGSGGLGGFMYLGTSVNLWVIMLFMKMGGAVFYYWYVSVIKSLSWVGGLILMIFQKISVLFVLSELVSLSVVIGGIVSLIVGVVGSFSQMSTKVLMGYSSVHHLGWIVMLMGGGSVVWLKYLFMYGFVLWSVVYMFKYVMLSLVNVSFWESFGVVGGMLSLGGVPPFLGFFLKWMAFKELVDVDLVLVFFMVVFSVVMLYVYLRVVYGLLMGSGVRSGWEISVDSSVSLGEVLVLGGVGGGFLCMVS